MKNILILSLLLPLTSCSSWFWEEVIEDLPAIVHAIEETEHCNG